jgi:CBS domain-containing protein
MRIEHVYRPGAISCRPTDSLAKAARRMRAAQVGALAVCAGSDLDHLIGIISERDLVQAVADSADVHATPVGAYTSLGTHTAQPHEDTSEVANRMLDLGIRHMPVASGRTVLGMVSMRDLLAVETWA